VYAVIQAGGKQVRVSEGAIIQLETQNAKPGDSITFADVLLFSENDNLNIGGPLVDKANVFGTVLDVIRSSKVLVFKKKRRKQYRRMRGHRQYLMRIRIDEMGLYSERKKAPVETPAPAATGRRERAEGAAALAAEPAAKEVKPARKPASGRKPEPRAAAPARKAAAARKATAADKKKAAAKPKPKKASDAKKKKK